MEYQAAEESETGSEFENANKELDANANRRKNSFVWQYFRVFDSSQTSYVCTICESVITKIGRQTSNLARHLEATHNITSNTEARVRHRPSRSFIWKYCTKEDSKHARCHLCNKLLYFGGGNTTNISKHLQRKHKPILVGAKHAGARKSMDEGGSASGNEETPNHSFSSQDPQAETAAERKERKGGSYVWNYCDKLTRNTICCKLCNKVMSFHGTANVITHLQRKHNIVGRLEKVENSLVPNGDVGEQAEYAPMETEESDTYQAHRKRTSLSSSIVWKYCTRIGVDAVRCGFCKKNLSYQGTSNLQRHLHRMHGVVTQGRLAKDADRADLQYKELNSNFIWEHSTAVDEDRMKCNMCNAIFENKEEVGRHLTVVHNVEPRRPGKRRRELRQSFGDDYDDDDDDNISNDFKDLIEVDRKYVTPEQNSTECNGIKLDYAEEDYIEELPEKAHQSSIDEDPFDPNTVQEITTANPLSSESSRASSPDLSYKGKKKKFDRLKEDRLRMETDYFREKASFYRMQKYLTALQAKKLRLELERLGNVDLNSSVNESDLIGVVVKGQP